VQRLLLEVVGVLVLLGAFALWQRHQGALGCLNANQLAVSTQQTRAVINIAIDQTDVRNEVSAYVDTIRLPVVVPRDVPRVRCVRDPPAPTVPTDHSTGPVGDAGHQLRAADRAVAAQPADEDLSGPALTIGRDANAQIKALKDYINHVCLRPS
jgi:hypothetical protein